MEKYIIVSAGHSFSLQVYVNEKIEEGYIPSGGLTHEEETGLFYQAMVLSLVIEN